MEKDVRHVEATFRSEKDVILTHVGSLPVGTSVAEMQRKVCASIASVIQA
jgi:hypothetical protein